MAMTAEQNANIADFWSKNKGNPQAVMDGMTQFGVGVDDVANAIGRNRSEVGNYLTDAGAARGFGGFNKGITDTYYGSAADPSQYDQAKVAAAANPNVVAGPAAPGTTASQMIGSPAPTGANAPSGLSTGPVPSLYDRLNPATATNQPNSNTTGSSTTSTSNGIINSYIPSNVAAPQWSVTPQMTVQGQLGTVMDANSPLMQQAKTQGLQMANERGLLNSSIAQSAAQDSMYKAALPIASADASMYGKSASENAGNATQISGANISANTSLANTASNNATTLATNTANNETSRANAKLQTDAAAALGVNEATYKQLAQGSSSAAQLMTNYQSQMAAMLRDTSFGDTASRQAAIDHLTNSTKAAIQMVGATAGNLDIAQYMNQLFPD